MLIEKMDLSALQCEVYFNDELLAYVGEENIGKYDEAGLRAKIAEWIMQGDECAA